MKASDEERAQMTDYPSSSQTVPVSTSQPGVLRQKLPYVIALFMAVVGVAYTSAVGQPPYLYWELLAVMISGACIVIDWGKTEDRSTRFRLAGLQILHWFAVLIAMNIMLLPSVNGFLNSPATGLVLMLLLALGAFTSGIRTSWDIAFLGLAMALSVPALGWFKNSALVLFLLALVVVAIGLLFWPRSAVARSS
jgi:hypothetical protein